MSLVETATASASGSILAFVLIKLWRTITRRVKVKGLLVDRKIEELETYSNDDILFVNISKELGKEYKELARHDVRLKVFPLAKKVLNLLKEQFRKKVIVIVSNDIELLEYMNITKKNMNGLLPSDKYLLQLQKAEPNNSNHNSLKLRISNVINKKNLHIYDNDDEIFKNLRELYKINLK